MAGLPGLRKKIGSISKDDVPPADRAMARAMLKNLNKRAETDQE